jgi:hypothetical protein
MKLIQFVYPRNFMLVRQALYQLSHTASSSNYSKKKKKMEGEETLQNSFCEASITLM